MFKFKKKDKDLDEQTEVIPDVSERRLCRRLRRYNMIKSVSNGSNPYTSEGLRMLETHLWHSKRFKMTKAWGHVIASSIPGR